ncbi:MAG: acyltransferase [Candidatus Freyarchaeota archaeon]|nr:DapH/DapD/GlmU-related protein [Candidatus Freyrarchaeum guaymaensis]
MSNPPRLLLRLALNILLAGLASLLPSILTAVLTYYAVVYLLHLPFIIVVGLAPLYYIVAKWCFKLFFLALARAQLRPVKEGLHGPGFEDENIRNWLINISLVDAVKYFVGDPPLGQTALRPPLLRLLGAKLGKGISLDDVTDPYLVEMEDGAVAGGRSFIVSHLSRDGKLYLKKVKIGRGALIGVRSTIFPGVEIGEGAVVAAHSLVPMDTKIPPYTLWAGAPAKQVETLRRKETKQ